MRHVTHSAEPDSWRLNGVRRFCLLLAFFSTVVQLSAADAGVGRQGGIGPGGSAAGGGSAGYSKGRTEKDETFGYTDGLTWINKYAADLEKKRGAEIPEAREALSQIQVDAQFLRQRWVEWPQKHPGQSPYAGSLVFDGYYRALVGSRKQLESAKSARKDEALDIIKAVATDLHAKAENCRHSADGLGKGINVTVHTRQGTNELSGFQVWCAPMALVRFTNEHICFPKISSPTVYKNFPPGFYAMWLTKDGRKSPQQSHLIGGKGQTEFPLDLVVESDATDRK